MTLERLDPAVAEADHQVTRRLQFVVATVATLVLLGIAWAMIGRPGAVPESQEPVERPKDMFAGIPPYEIKTPPCVPAASAHLPDGEEVVGVIVGGKPRAYSLRAFAGSPLRHIVNDLVDGTPVSIAHCDMNGCTHIFTSEQKGKPLPVLFGGKRHGAMWIRAEGRAFQQHDLKPYDPSQGTEFPYPEMAFEKTTWGAWRQAHPDTDVYVGVQLHFGPEEKQGEPESQPAPPN